MVKDGRRVGVGLKCSDAPSMTRSIHVALAELQLEALCVVYPGARRYRLGERVEVVPLQALTQ